MDRKEVVMAKVDYKFNSLYGHYVHYELPDCVQYTADEVMGILKNAFIAFDDLINKEYKIERKGTNV